MNKRKIRKLTRSGDFRLFVAVVSMAVVLFALNAYGQRPIQPTPVQQDYPHRTYNPQASQTENEDYLLQGRPVNPPVGR